MNNGVKGCNIISVKTHIQMMSDNKVVWPFLIMHGLNMGSYQLV